VRLSWHEIGGSQAGTQCGPHTVELPQLQGFTMTLNSWKTVAAGGA
jgi:hypothetical protein